MGFLEDLAKYDDEFTEATPSERMQVFSDGQHQVIITAFRIEEGQYGTQLVAKFRGKDSKTGNPGTITKWYNIDPLPDRSDFKWQMLYDDLNLLGFDMSVRKLKELVAVCESEEMIHVLCSIGVKRNAGTERDYINMYLNAVHGKVEPSQVERYTGGISDRDEESAGDFASEADDDIPF